MDKMKKRFFYIESALIEEVDDFDDNPIPRLTDEQLFAIPFH